MPHLQVHVTEELVAGREAPMIAALTDAVVAVLGEPVGPAVSIDLVAVPPGRTAVGGVITA